MLQHIKDFQRVLCDLILKEKGGPTIDVQNDRLSVVRAEPNYDDHIPELIPRLASSQ